MSKIFTNPTQLEEWVEASLCIQEHYDIEKALGYVIGGKFYNLLCTSYAARKICRLIQEETKKPDYNSIRGGVLKRQQYTENIDEICQQKKEIIMEAEGLLVKFAFLISETFEAHDIRRYFESHPRLGVHGHISDEQFDFMVSRGAVEHSIHTEVEDALIFRDMLKYFEINV